MLNCHEITSFITEHATAEIFQKNVHVRSYISGNYISVYIARQYRLDEFIISLDRYQTVIAVGSTNWVHPYVVLSQQILTCYRNICIITVSIIKNSPFIYHGQISTYQSVYIRKITKKNPQSSFCLLSFNMLHNNPRDKRMTMSYSI